MASGLKTAELTSDSINDSSADRVIALINASLMGTSSTGVPHYHRGDDTSRAVRHPLLARAQSLQRAGARLKKGRGSSEIPPLEGRP